jgi:hypothetical protein
MIGGASVSSADVFASRFSFNSLSRHHRNQSCQRALDWQTKNSYFLSRIFTLWR